MLFHTDVSKVELRELIVSNQIQFGGNAKLRIYGTLSCSSGKRMKRQNRVFFTDEKEAIAMGFRPCGHCLREKYRLWIEQVSG